MIAVAVWASAGVSIAAAVSAFGLSFYVLLAVPRMAEVAAVLGLIHGVWLHITATPNSRQPWFGAISGAILGVFEFPAVLSQSELMLERGAAVALFVTAAVFAGVVSGAVSAAFVRAPRELAPRSVPLKLAIGCLIVASLLFINQRLYWKATVDRLPVPQVSRGSLAELNAGNAHGSAWTGCYWYSGHTRLDQGGENGLLKVTQNDGNLHVFTHVSQYRMEMAGGVDQNGRFRFGGEAKIGSDTLRYLWQGKFDGNSIDYVRRSTLLNGSAAPISDRLTGSADRTDCSKFF